MIKLINHEHNVNYERHNYFRKLMPALWLLHFKQTDRQYQIRLVI